MHLYDKKKTFNHKSLLGAILLFVLLVLLSFPTIGGVEASSREEQEKQLRQSIQQAAATCYAIEGRYPASLSYIEEHYGVVIDEERYQVYYEVFASNIAPNIQVKTKEAKG